LLQRFAGRDIAAQFGGLIGIAAARTGDTLRALQIADSLGRVNRRWDFGKAPEWRAAILAEVGHKADAVESLRQASQRFGSNKFEWLASPYFRSLRGFPAFDAFVAVR
jgi:hypothetical protein